MSKAQAPPVNLKERIAALQQRNVTPPTQKPQISPVTAVPATGSVGALRDRIAKFEKKGGVPVPRGSFGLGAPPTEGSQSTRSRELYANRIGYTRSPSVGSNHPSLSRSGSPLPPTDSNPSDSDSPLPETPEPSLPSTPSGDIPRRNSITNAAVSGRRVVSDTSAFVHSDPYKDTSPSIEKEATESLPTTPSIIVSTESSQAPLVPGPVAPDREPEEISQEEAQLKTTSSKVSTPTEPKPSGNGSASLLAENSKGAEVNNICDVETTTDVVSSPSVTIFPPPTSSQESVNIKVSQDSAKSSTPTAASEANPKATKAVSPSVRPAIVPPTTDHEINYGSVTISHAPTARPTKTTTFSAVVHRKSMGHPPVTPPTSQTAPVTPQLSRVRRTVQAETVQAPQSPGYGDLAELLEEAALLEMRLMEGPVDETTVEPQHRLESMSEEEEHDAAIETSEEPEEDESIEVPAEAVEEPVPENVRSPSPVPSLAKPDPHTPENVPSPSPSPLRIPSGIPPETRSIRQSISASTITDDFASIHVEDADSMPPTPPPKSPLPRYLSGIRRFTSNTGSLRSMPGAYPRNSMSASSEISSEDSTPVVTPLDSVHDHESNNSVGNGWPSVKSKKSISSIGRASSFAERIFRKRTKSGVSIVDSGYAQVNPHARPLSTNTHTLSPPSTPQNPMRRPNSWMSHSSANTSVLSPATTIFDNEFFDAFPGVPQGVPDANRSRSPSPTPGPLHPFPSSRTDPRLSTSSKNYSQPMLNFPESMDPAATAPLGRSTTLPPRSRKYPERKQPKI